MSGPLALLRTVCLVAIALLAGCRPAGTRDVELEYSFAPADAPKAGRGGGDLEARVRRRLAPMDIAADIQVDEAHGALHLIVDRDASGLADALVRWRGGFAVHALAPALAFAPADKKGLTERRETSPDGAVEYFTGSWAAVRAAIHRSRIDADHIVLPERVDHRTARTRVIGRTPLVELPYAIEHVDRADGGRAVAIRLTRSASERIEALGPTGPIALVAAGKVLAVRAAGQLEPSFEVPFGADVEAYGDAHVERRLLGTPTLPALAQVGRAELPTNWPLALLSIALPLLLSIAWLAFIRRFDRAVPEPIWLVAATFGLGALSTLPAIVVEHALGAASPYLNPRTMTLGGQVTALPLSIPIFTFSVGLVEEGAKLLGVWVLALRRKEFDEPVDGIVYAAASSIGFACAENYLYFVHSRLSPSVVGARGLLCVSGHFLLGALWGYALGQALVSGRRRLLAPMFLAAAIAHGAYDAFVLTEGTLPLGMVVEVGLAAAFLVLVRRALRHGVVTGRRGHPPVPARGAAFFRVGRRFSFVACCAGMLVSTAVLVGVFRGYARAHQNVAPPFLLAAGFLALLVGLFAYGVTALLPLDVVVDDRGVTFAGSTRRWKDIGAVEPSARRGWILPRRFLTLRASEGDLELGPATAMTLETLGNAIAMRLGARRHETDSPRSAPL